MIYLIGGAPRCGKTTLAKKLAKKLNISWISADTLEGIVKVSVNEDLHVEMFPKDVIRKTTKNSNDIMYSEFSADEIRNAYIKQAEASSKAIDTMIEFEVGEGHDYIIEGHQLQPVLIAKLIKKYGTDNITAIVLTRFDVNGIVEGGLKHKAKNDWFIQKTKEHNTYYKIAEMLSSYSKYFYEESDKYKIKTHNVDKDFLNDLDTAMNLIIENY